MTTEAAREQVGKTKGIDVKVRNWGVGRFGYEPAIAVGLGDERVLFTPNQARLIVRRLENAIADCERRRKTA